MASLTQARARRAESLPPAQRRAMIVEAMLPLLLEHGDMVTSRQIAEAAGIAEGTIFRVFADKDELIGAVIALAVDPTPTDDALSAIDVEAPLQIVVEAAVRVLQRRALDIARVMASVAPRHHPHGPITDRPSLIALFEAHREELSVQPVAAARWLQSLTIATSHPMLSSEPAEPELITTLFLHGVCPGSDGC